MLGIRSRAFLAAQFRPENTREGYISAQRGQDPERPAMTCSQTFPPHQNHSSPSLGIGPPVCLTLYVQLHMPILWGSDLWGCAPVLSDPCILEDKLG
jgi:hypothetical protein